MMRTNPLYRLFFAIASVVSISIAPSALAQLPPPSDTIKFLPPLTPDSNVFVEIQTPQPVCFASPPASITLSGNTVNMELDVLVPCPGDAPIDIFFYSLGMYPAGSYNLVVTQCVLISPPNCSVIISAPFVVTAVAAAPVPVPALSIPALLTLIFLMVGTATLLGEIRFDPAR